MVAVVMVINYGVLLASDKVAPYLSTAVVQLLEIVLGIFLGALAIQLAINGLADLGIITLSGH
jgi:small neutral amino acid transporter SnatA (MarC family)